MAITLLCPKLQCRAILRVPDSMRGKRIRCGECGAAFYVPNTPKASNLPKKPVQGESEK